VPEISGGDLCVQACANDPQLAVHAIRNLARIARGTAVVRYSQLGFGRTSSSQQAARNLMGFKDGTNNIKAEDTATVDRYVWAQRGNGPDWMTAAAI
jgi:deferrochelatase/peroxidase EfeB